MPRIANPRRLVPREALCHGCGRPVPLSNAARARRRFRCPHCQSDNRVDHTGLGAPLRGEQAMVDVLPQIACRHCRSLNEIPRPLLLGASYRCHACQRVEPLPRELRLNRSRTSAIVTVLLVSTVVAIALLGWQVRGLAGDLQQRMTAETVQMIGGTIQLTDGKALVARDGVHYELRGTVTNLFDRPVTLYIHVRLLHGDQTVLTQIVPVPHVPPRQTRGFGAALFDRGGRRAEQYAASLFGVS